MPTGTAEACTLLVARPALRLNKITKDAREYGAQKEIDEEAALGVGMNKAEEFVASGGEVSR